MNTPRMASKGLLFRVGEGWDTHALVAGRRLVLGGVEIAHSHGLLGYSDADALCHAVTDALFGAAALGDIGHHFPDTDEQFRGADSIALLGEAARRVRVAGFEIGNAAAYSLLHGPRTVKGGQDSAALAGRQYPGGIQNAAFASVQMEV